MTINRIILIFFTCRLLSISASHALQNEEKITLPCLSTKHPNLLCPANGGIKPDNSLKPLMNLMQRVVPYNKNKKLPGKIGIDPKGTINVSDRNGAIWHSYPKPLFGNQNLIECVNCDNNIQYVVFTNTTYEGFTSNVASIDWDTYQVSLLYSQTNTYGHSKIKFINDSYFVAWTPDNEIGDKIPETSYLTFYKINKNVAQKNNYIKLSPLRFTQKNELELSFYKKCLLCLSWISDYQVAIYMLSLDNPSKADIVIFDANTLQYADLESYKVRGNTIFECLRINQPLKRPFVYPLPSNDTSKLLAIYQNLSNTKS